MFSMAQAQHALGSRVHGICGCRAGTPIYAIISNAAGSHECDVGVASPISTFLQVVGEAHRSGAGEGLGAGSSTPSPSVFVKYCVLHQLTELRGMSQPFQLNYKTNIGPHELGLFHPNWYQHQNPSSS